MPTSSEVVRRVYDAFSRHDNEAMLTFLSPNMEWARSDVIRDRGPSGPPKGLKDIFAHLERARSVFSELQLNPREYVEQDDRVVVFGAYHLRGAHSGVSGTVPFVHSWRLSEGLATHFEDLHDPALLGRIIEDEKAPAVKLFEMNVGHIRARVAQLFAELALGDLIGDTTRNVAELAAKTSTDAEALHRLLRTASGFGLVTEPEPGQFAVTRLGSCLRSDHPFSVRSTMIMNGLYGRVLGDAEYSLRTGTSAFPKTYGVPFFTYLEQNPGLGDTFNRSMTELSRLEAGGLVAAYDFSAQRIVDVGGGDATLLCAMLTAAPQASGVVFDLAGSVAAAQARIAAAGLDDRCTVESGDFFSAVPPDGDLYVLKWIIHDWPDEQAVAILRNCREAMAPGARLLLIEHVVPEGNMAHRSKVMDFAMLVTVGGRERTRTEYAELLAASGLRLEGVFDGPVGSTFSFIEARPVPPGRPGS